MKNRTHIDRNYGSYLVVPLLSVITLGVYRAINAAGLGGPNVNSLLSVALIGILVLSWIRHAEIFNGDTLDTVAILIATVSFFLRKEIDFAFACALAAVVLLALFGLVLGKLIPNPPSNKQ